MLRKLFFFLILVAFSSAHGADTLVLSNGDKISGTLISEDNGVIIFSSPILGTITVPTDQASVELEAAAPDEVAAEAQNPIDDEPSADKQQEEIDMVSQSLRDAKQWVEDNKPTGWTGKLSVGVTYVESNTETLGINFSLDGKKDSAPNHYRYNLYYQYDQSIDENGIETQNLDKYGAGVGYDYDITEWIFLNSDFSYLVDQVRDIRHQADLDLGLGFRIINEEDMTLNVIPAYTLQYKDAEGIEQRWFHLATLKQDFMYRFSEIVRFEQSASASIAPADTNDYQYMVKAALISKLTDWIDASITYQLTFDNTIADSNARREQQLIFGLGVPY